MNRASSTFPRAEALLAPSNGWPEAGRQRDRLTPPRIRKQSSVFH